MENATKALLIAAAVLIAILIISFALIIYNMASETVGNVNLSEAEIAQFNAKFKSYNGEVLSKAQFEKLMSKIITHNQQEKEAGTNRYVTLTNNGNSMLDENVTTIKIFDGKIPTDRDWKIECVYQEGLIRQINVSSVLKDK